MVRNETKLMESAIALAEELHFQRAAEKVNISQPMLTKNIQELETMLGGVLFERNRKHVVVTDAGLAYIEQARKSLLYGERAMLAAKAAMQEHEVTLYVGRSPYVDPFFVTTLDAIRLPLYPNLQLEFVSRHSYELIQELLGGSIDLAIANNPPESVTINKLALGESPFYIAVGKRDALAWQPSLNLKSLAGRRWILFERRQHPLLYAAILEEAARQNAEPSGIQTVTSAEEVYPFVADAKAVAFVVKAAALRLARHDVTVRPLTEDALKLKTYLVTRSDEDSKLVSQLVRAYMRKTQDVSEYKQLKLPAIG